jgi:membrane protease YdiL (CAAX protease family)
MAPRNHAGLENGYRLTGTGGQIVTWVALLFVLLFLCLLPFLIRHVTLPGLAKLSPSSLLFGLCAAGMTLTGFTPMLSALLVVGLFPGAGGVRPFLRQIKTWRVGIGWYALALLGPMVLLVVDTGVKILLGGTAPKQWLVFPSPTNPGPGGLIFLCVQLVLSFTEEFGWRGFALPRLQERHYALTASLLIGLIWGTYHLWIMPICPHCLSLTDVLVTQYLRLIATAVIYGWMYNSTKGSLFLVMLAHAGHNLWTNLLPGVGGSPVIVALSYVAVAVVVVLMTDPRTLTRLANHMAPTSKREANPRQV